jgi:hypothetical protein
LGTLVTTRQKNNQLAPSLLEIHPVTGTVIDSQLRDSFANGFDIPGISSSKPFNPCQDTGSSLDVTQVVKPPSEEDGFANFNHGLTVSAWLRFVNSIPPALPPY